MNGSLSIAARLDQLPVSRFHYRIAALIGAGLFLDTFDLYLGGSVSGTVLKLGWSTIEQNAWFGTMSFIGLVIGSFCAGILGDRFGRRFTYQLNLAIFGLASLAAVFAPNMQVLIGLRLIMGIGMGAEIVIAYGTLSEFLPPGVRGRFLSILALFGNSSVFITSFVGLWVIPNLGWRYMFAIVGIGALIVWVLRKGMPESPRWLDARGRIDEAELLMRHIEAEAGLVPSPSVPMLRTPPAPPVPISVLFTSGVLPRTLVGSMIMIVIGFSVFGFIGWLPTFFVKQGFDIVQSLTWSTVMSLGGPAGTIIGLLAADRYGRKPTIIASTIFVSIFGALYVSVGSAGALLALGFALVTAIYVLGTVGQCIYVAELFSTQYRMRGTGISATAGRGASAIVQFLVIWLFQVGGIAAVVCAVIIAQLLLGLVIWLFGIETKNRSLEEIARTDVASGGAVLVEGSASTKTNEALPG